MLRAAAANFLAEGVDGLYTWFLPWPLGSEERSILTELGDPDRIAAGDKHYTLRRHCKAAEEYDYGAGLPLSITRASSDDRRKIRFTISDDMGSDRIQQIGLSIGISNLVTGDALEIALNGCVLDLETCRRSPIRSRDPYAGQRLEFALRPTQLCGGRNEIEFVLHERPTGLEGGIVVEDVEISVEYGTYPSTLPMG